MADGFIVRKGGVTTEQALAPTITEVSTTDSSITFTITNNDAETAIIRHRLDDITDEGVIVELATSATSSNIVVTGLAQGTAFDVYATANVTGKVKSNVTELEISTDTLIFTAATGGTTLEYNSGGKRFRSHTFTSDGNFVVSTVGDNVDDRNKVDFFIIAGGGGGGHDTNSQIRIAGGGAGGVVQGNKVITTTNFPIIIGSGGVGGADTFARGLSGSDSSALAESIAVGGGGAGSGGARVGKSGGSGGGQGGSGGAFTPNNAPGTAGQGNQGGTGSGPGGDASGGGGGFSTAGQNAVGPVAGNGGLGFTSNLRNGSNVNHAGGGGLSNQSFGGGFFDSFSATANTGSGGAGTTGNGSAGIVVIRYEIAPSV